MNLQFVTILDPPPEGFRLIRPVKRELLRGNLVILVPDLDEIVSSIENFHTRVRGIVITIEKEVTLRKIGTMLWHMSITERMIPMLPSRLQPFFELFSEGETLFIESTNLKMERDILQEEVSSLREDYNLTMDRLRQRVTQLTKIQQILQASEEHLHTTLISIGDAVISTDLQSRITMMNPVAEALTGWSIEEARDRPLTEVYRIVDSRTGVLFESPAEIVLNSGRIAEMTEHTTLISRDGKQFQVSDSAAPIRNEQGVLQGVVMVFRDISVEYRTREALHRAENYIRNIFNSMPSVLVGVDTDGFITHWNRQAEIETEISMDEAMGHHLHHLIPHMAPEMDTVFKAMKTRQSQIKSKVMRTINNVRKYEDITIYPLITDRLDGAVIRIDDVTERVRMEELMIQSEKMLSVGGLAAGMAHEINNPLAGIMQNVAVVLNRLRSNLKANDVAASEAGTSMSAVRDFLDKRHIFHLLENIDESVVRATQTVRNMLNFVRKSESDFNLCNMTALIDSTVELARNDFDLKTKYDFRKIEIVKDYDSDLPPIPCEYSKIQQVIFNILKNGAEAMWEKFPMDDDTPQFVLRLKREKHYLRVEIENNGPELDPETRKRIFEPFFTTKPVGVGTGLGLSLSYFIIAENHDGSLEVETTPDKGTVFILRLPLERSV